MTHINMKTIKSIFAVAIVIFFITGCKKNNTGGGATPSLIFVFKFDSTQARLNNVGQPATMPSGHAGQCPQMNVMAAHYIELAANDLVPLGSGSVLYQTPMVTAGGASAIDFTQEKQVANGDTFFSVPIKNLTPGTYQYLRVSLAYQNYTVQMFIDSSFTYAGVSGTIDGLFPSTIASFVGVNTYIPNFKIKDSTLSVYGDRLQGYWGFETLTTTSITGVGNYSVGFVDSGQAPAGATTVVNPIFATSPIPSGSCVVTAAFDSTNGTAAPLRITGNETQNIVVTVSLSTNKSFEWIDVIPDNQWEPLKGENIVDMGIRGMIPYIQY